ncbi:hypothetical protein BSZ39_10535 [Bowdeniella nasicola]|uniref:Sulfatase N-terminal domain-containing protein n=1 Tax=Bowdeniella nasicola TaxID=208480 RepID=A0A1Q5Q0K5_9ACTO|nr:hypothetical protein [Bowdeniella nasicola]OKL53235.1 hypothetical protein BSZ39_10535 [Bowdeniella nasicola]
MAATANSVKNSLIIVTDQHRTDTIGALGGPTHTPVLEDFASEGFAFRKAFTPTAICPVTFIGRSSPEDLVAGPGMAVLPCHR